MRLLLSSSSSSSKWNADLSASRCFPLAFFVIIGMILLHHGVLLFIQLKSSSTTPTTPTTTTTTTSLLVLPVEGYSFHPSNNMINNHARTSIRHQRPYVAIQHQQPSSTILRQQEVSQMNSMNQEQSYENSKENELPQKSSETAASIVVGSAIFISTLTTSIAFPTASYGYSSSNNEFISEPVQTAIQAVNDAKSSDDLVKAYENIADIIIEGKGVGGTINFRGVQLDRGYVSDEDTSIYNPGLTLLTETEKSRLVDTVVQSKKKQYSVMASANTGNNNNNNADMNQYWNNDLDAGYNFLRERLDPLHMYELRGYLSILPIYGAIMYLIVLGIQQVARDVFPIAYILCASAIFVPIIALVVIGPQ